MPFDADSGLVYTETIVSQRQKRRIGAEDIYDKKLRIRPGQGVSQEGAHSLRDTAILCLLRNLDLLDAESLQTVPDSILRLIWTNVCQNNLDSNALWKIFAPTGCLGLSSVRTQMHQVHGNMQEIIPQLISPSFAWMIDLTLSGGFHSAADFIHVSSIPNLKFIHIIRGRGQGAGFDDKIFRSWADAARLKGCFGRLEAIFIDGHEDVTNWSLQYLNSFPALDTFAVHYCKVSKSAKAPGWIKSDDRRVRGLFMQFILEKSNKTGEANYRFYKNWSPLIEAYLSKRRQLEADHRKAPLLKVHMHGRHWNGHGLPKSGIHIDQTYCFERDWKFNPENHVIDQTEKQHAKKRKLKDGKALPLNTILDSL